MKSTRFQFSNGTTTVDSIANTLAEAARGVSHDYTFTGVTSDMFYTHAAFAEEFRKQMQVHRGLTGESEWLTKPTIKDWTDSGFILCTGDENTPSFQFSFKDKRVTIDYVTPRGADGHTIRGDEHFLPISISMEKPVPRIVADFMSRMWGRAVKYHAEVIEKVRQSNDRKQAQERTLDAIRTMFKRGSDKWNPVRIGGDGKGWFGDAWVMDHNNVRITVDSIDSVRALKILQFISELK